MDRALRRVGLAIGLLFAMFVALPALAIAVFFVFYDWNDARAPLARLAGGALGRDVAIAGDLDVDIGGTTRVELHGLQVANAPWGKAGHLLRIGDLALAIEIWPLLRGDIVIPSLALAEVDGNLERNADGAVNWEFGDPGKRQAGGERRAEGADEPASLPLVESLAIDGARIDFDDRRLKKTATLTLDRLRMGEDAERRKMTAEASGTYAGRKARLDATMGSFTLLREGAQPYPLDVALVAGDFNAKLAGTIDDPQALEGLNLDLKIGGDDLSNLVPLTGIPVPPTPPYALSGRLERNGATWLFRNFAGKLGDSDMQGTIAATLGGARPRIEGDVTSTLLDLKDLSGFIGASEGGDAPPPAPRPDGRVLPDKDVDLQQLRAVDARIGFRGTRIVTPKVPIDRLEAQVSLEDGTLRAQPVSFAIGKGQVKVFLSLYGAEEPVRSDIEAVIRNVDIRRLLQEGAGDVAARSAGAFNGRAKLSATGTSVADIAGSATGELMVVLSDGRFSGLMTELMGLDIAEALGFLIEGDRSIPIRCIVADFGADRGLFTARTLIFDTSDTQVVGTGTIDMRSERLDLRLRPLPKDFSPFSLRTPISVQGTLAEPDAFPDPADIGVEGVVNKALNTVLTVVTGVLPPVDLGPGEDAPCAALISRAR